MAWKIASFFPISNLFAGEYSFKFAFVNCSRTRKNSSLCERFSIARSLGATNCSNVLIFAELAVK
jgi:hypothetical protein